MKKAPFCVDVDEKELLSRIHDGDRKAFDLLYKHHSERIYCRLLKMTKLAYLAEELLQNTFVKLWEKRHLINSELSIKAWLHKVAENELYLFYRKSARDRKLQDHIISTFTEHYSHTEEDIFFKESNELLQHAIALLPPQRQQVFNLCKIEGKSYEEAAKIMGISTSTVSNQLVKANTAVRGYIFRSRGIVTQLIVIALLREF